MAPDTDTPYNPGYVCPECGTALVLIQKASRRRSATSRRHSFGYRQELWGCPRRGDADHHPWRGRYGWLEWAPEIQPPAAARSAALVDDECPF